MKRINAYLGFSGNCLEAMNFYRDCLGGELEVQTINDSDMADQFPPEMRSYVVHATLSTHEFVLMGTDLVDVKLDKKTAISLMIECVTYDEITHLYDKLAKGGIRTQPLEKSFWGALFGMITDRFGTQWVLHLPVHAGEELV